MIPPEDNVNIIIEKPSTNVLTSEFKRALKDLTNYVQRMNKRITLERAEVRVKESKYPTGKTAQFDITLQFDPAIGRQYVVYAKAKNYLKSLHTAMRQMEMFLEKNALRNKKHHKKSLSQALAETSQTNIIQNSI